MSPSAPAARRKLGEILVEAGVLTDVQLGSALGHQRQWGGRLGHILIDLRLIDEQTLAGTLAGQLGLELCGLDEPVDIEVVRMLPQSVAERHALFPVRFDGNTGGGTLTVAFSDPTNLTAIDEVRFQTGKTIQLAVASEGQIALAIRRYYYGEDPTLNPGLEAPDKLFGGAGGLLSEEEELVELEPLPSDSQVAIPTLGAPPPPPSATLAETLPNDPLAGFFADALPPSPRAAAAVAARAAAVTTPPPSRRSPPVARGLTDAAADVSRPHLTPEAEAFLAQAPDFSKQTVEGVVLPPGFLAQEPELLVSAGGALAGPLTELPIGHAAEDFDLDEQTREMPIFGRAAALGDSTRPGVDLGDLLEKLKKSDPPAPKPSQDSEITRVATQRPSLAALTPRPSPVVAPAVPAVPAPAAPDASLDDAFDITFGESSKVSAVPPIEAAPAPPPDPTTIAPATPLSPAPASRAAKDRSKADFSDVSDDDLGAVLSGLDGSPASSPTTVEAPFSPSDANYARALARLLVKKGLIEEAELLAELAAED